MYAASVLLLACTNRSWCDRLPGSVHAQSPARCTDPAYRQFDFWIGDWDVVEIEHPTTIVARARVELILNDCVVHEVYEAMDGHRGESFSIYDFARRTWHQTWVNDSGYLLTIEGGLRDQAMMLGGTDHLLDGKLRQVRGEWRSDGQGTREVAARSTDGGVTWIPWFDLLFRHHEPSRPD